MIAALRKEILIKNIVTKRFGEEEIDRKVKLKKVKISRNKNDDNSKKTESK